MAALTAAIGLAIGFGSPVRAEDRSPAASAPTKSAPAEPESDEDELRVRFIEWEGVRVLETETLEKAILTSRASWLPWRASRPFDLDVLEADRGRIELAYRHNGYYEAKVRASSEPSWFGGVRVRFEVDEGPPVLLAVRSIGLPAELPPEVDRANLLEGLPLSEGEAFSVVRYRAGRTLILERLAEAGYPNARVAGGAQVNLERHSAVVHWTVAPGRRARFGEIRIKGLAKVEEPLLRNELEVLGFEPGKAYSPSALREAQRKLYDLALFRSVSVEAEAPRIEPEVAPAVATADGGSEREKTGSGSVPSEGAAPEEGGPTAESPPKLESPPPDDSGESDPASADTVWPVEIRVNERPPRRFEFSVGYGTDDQFRTRGEWRHRNFFGGLRKVRLSGKYSFLVTGLDAEFVQPHFLRQRDLTLGLDAGLNQNDTPAYQSEGFSVGWRIERPLFEKVTGRLGQRFELREVTEVAASEQQAAARDNQSFQLSVLEFGLRRLDVDSKIDPHRGTTLELSLEPSLRAIGSELDYLRVRADLRGYVPLFFDDLVLAARLNLGVLEPLNGDDFSEVPIFKRFFSGGDASVRGFGFDLLGPVDVNNDPIGGLTLAEASLELRFPLWRFLGGVMFVDAGHVNRTALQIEFDDVFYSIGTGLRLWTPIGPLRLDVATPLNAPRSYPNVRVHFSVGHAF